MRDEEVLELERGDVVIVDWCGIPGAVGRRLARVVGTRLSAEKSIEVLCRVAKTSRTFRITDVLDDAGAWVGKDSNWRKTVDALRPHEVLEVVKKAPTVALLRAKKERLEAAHRDYTEYLHNCFPVGARVLYKRGKNLIWVKVLEHEDLKNRVLVWNPDSRKEYWIHAYTVVAWGEDK